MSDTTIPYHLRQNKAIERNLFIELLRRIGFAVNISDYQYIGFGGPFLEDYKLVHNALRITDMHSIERHENTHLRQKFNRPMNFIQLHHCDSNEFFSETLNTEKNSIVWLDYTSAKQLSDQIHEFVHIASGLGVFDVLKVTLNANPSTLGFADAKPAKQRELRREELHKRIGSFMPGGIDNNDMIHRNYPNTLQTCLRYALSSLPRRVNNLAFHPAASFTYSDGAHKMLTVTGVILSAGDNASETFLRKSRLEHWKFSNLNWSFPREISVPSLSIKERLHIEEILPISDSSVNVAEKLQEKLGFKPCTRTADLENYAEFYRAFPYFSKVSPT